MEERKQKIDLNILGKSDEQVAMELDKSELQLQFVAIVKAYTDRGDEVIAAELNDTFSKCSETQLQKKYAVLKPHLHMLDD